MSSKPLKCVTNLLVVLTLFIVLGPVRQHFYASTSIRKQEREAAQLVNTLREHLTIIGLDVQKARAQGQEIIIVGPPDGTLYERTERVTLRWSSEQPLSTGERYVVTVAYYKQDQVTIPLEPVIVYLVTTEETLQLSSLDADLNLPVIAWTVYVAEENIRAPAGPVSETYRLLHLSRRPVHSGYHCDQGL